VGEATAVPPTPTVRSGFADTPDLTAEYSDQIMLLMLFVPFDRKSDPNVYRAETGTQAGTYAVTVPAGKYRISLQQMDPVPTHDLLNFKYSIRDSPVVYDVGGPGEFNIDLPRELPGGGGKQR
jgi:hypothetical protein